MGIGDLLLERELECALPSFIKSLAKILGCLIGAAAYRKPLLTLSTDYHIWLQGFTTSDPHSSSGQGSCTKASLYV